jgi:hypothetical protein
VHEVTLCGSQVTVIMGESAVGMDGPVVITDKGAWRCLVVSPRSVEADLCLRRFASCYRVTPISLPCMLLCTGTRVPADVVYPCLGGVPNTEFLRSHFEGNCHVFLIV